MAKIEPMLAELMGGHDALDVAGVVAEILEKHPERHNQGSWCGFGIGGPGLVATRRTCGTSGCVAGWAVAVASVSLGDEWVEVPSWPDETDDPWMRAGAEALGIERPLAHVLFDGRNRRDRLIEALRVLSRLEQVEGLGAEITAEQFFEALPPGHPVRVAGSDLDALLVWLATRP